MAILRWLPGGRRIKSFGYYKKGSARLLCPSSPSRPSRRATAGGCTSERARERASLFPSSVIRLFGGPIARTHQATKVH